MAGQPTKHNGGETNDLVYRLSLLGLTDKEMASVLEIDVSTFGNWKNDFPEFLESIKKGKDIADANVAKSLYERANGYEYEEVRKEKGKSGEYEVDKTTKTTKHIAPDVGAIAFWLKNRRGKKWNDRIPTEEDSDEKPILDNGDKLPED